MTKVFRVSIVFLLPLLFVVSINAQDTTTASAGNSGGGEPFSIKCDSNKMLVGIKGRTGLHVPFGNLVNSVQPICVAVDAGGAWVGSAVPLSQHAGDDDHGYETTLMCSPGEAVSALVGRAGIYVDQLKIQCAFIGEYGTLRTTGSTAPDLIGGGGGDSFGGLACSGSKAGRGLSGRAHDWIDQIALICGVASTPSATVSTFFLDKTTVVGGGSVKGTIELNATAPSGGTSVQLSKQVNVGESIYVPESGFSENPVKIQAGSKQASFTYTTIPVPTSVNLQLNPGLTTRNVSKTVSILPPSLIGLSFSPAKVTPASSVTGLLKLNGNAPTTGVTVTLTSSITAVATVPPNTVIPPGSYSTSFPISLASGNKSGCSVITASGVFAPPGSDSQKQSLLAVLASENPEFDLAVGNPFGSATGVTVTLRSVSKVAETFTLESSNPALVSVPGSMMIQPASQTGNFNITLLSRPATGIACATVYVTDPNRNVNALVFSIDSAGLKLMR